MPKWSEALFENSYDVTVVADLDGRVSFITPSVTRVLGYSVDELMGRSGFDFLHLDDLSSALATQAESLGDPDASPTLEVRARHKDGSIRWLELVLSNRFDDPDIQGLVANIRDITRRKAMEERLAAMIAELAQRNRELAEAVADRDRLVATVSHEMRAPLTLVIGLSQTLRSAWDRLSEEDKFALLTKVEQRGQQLAAIIDDLIVLGRVERSGGGDSRCEVASVIRDAIEATTVDGQVSVSCAPGLVARADPIHVGQILTNYLTNAARYGSPPLVVEASADGNWIDIRVKDEGPGVPPEFVRDLFEPFTRSAGAREVAADGSGLGLAIVRELARAEGGEAWYEQNSPQGSCFAVRLPA